MDIKLQQWECTCGWSGSEMELRRHPSGSLGCPQCMETEGLGGVESAEYRLQTFKVGDLLPDIDPVIVAIAVRRVRDQVDAHLRVIGRPAVDDETFARWFSRHSAEELGDLGDGRPVEVLKVPRCETCRWWTGERGVTDPERLAVSGECRRHLDGDAPEPFWTEPPLAEDSERKWSRIYTVRDHRCGQWEGKGDE